MAYVVIGGLGHPGTMNIETQIKYEQPVRPALAPEK